MRIFDTSIPGADEHDGRNAQGCRDLFCEKYFEANPGKNVIYATYYGTRISLTLIRFILPPRQIAIVHATRAFA